MDTLRKVFHTWRARRELAKQINNQSVERIARMYGVKRRRGLVFNEGDRSLRRRTTAIALAAFDACRVSHG